MNITITGADIGIAIALLSVALAVLFWWLSGKEAKIIIKQTNEAKRVLGEIDSRMDRWQSKVNDAQVKLIESRPEIIAEKVSMEAARSESQFIEHLGRIIDKLSSDADADSIGYRMAIVRELLEHQKSLILERDKIKADVIAVPNNKSPQENQ